MNRLRKEIIDLDTEKIYKNELMASKDTGISRYYIHKSIENNIPTINHQFALYFYGMNVQNLKNQYKENLRRLILRKKIKDKKDKRRNDE
jgi:hypothetical protein